jgi:hypothetical protein
LTVLQHPADLGNVLPHPDRPSERRAERPSGDPRLAELDGAPPLEWAVAYAAHGFEVMPRFESRGSLLDALRGSPRTGLLGEAEVRDFWNDYPATPAVAVVCGPVSGLLVLDVDQHSGGADGLAELRRLETEHGALPPTPMVLSPSGSGRHLYFRWPGSRVRNGPVAPGLEVLGDRMAATLPPSTKGGRPYQWSLARHSDFLSMADPPAWLIEMMRPPAPPSQRPRQIICQGDRYARAALERELDVLARVAPGGRNATVNRSAWSLARLVQAGALDASEVERALVEAAQATGLSAREAAATVRGALRRRCSA